MARRYLTRDIVMELGWANQRTAAFLSYMMAALRLFVDVEILLIFPKLLFYTHDKHCRTTILLRYSHTHISGMQV